MIWAMYTEMTHQLWVKKETAVAPNGHYCGEEVEVYEAAWEERMAAAVETGANTMVIELAEGPIYESHPELALKGSRPMTWVNGWVRKMKAAGLDVVPMLNFSLGHGNWLGPYARMVSTPTYYKVCRDLIREVYDVFEKPKYFHIGMDEEDPGNSGVRKFMAYYRQGDLLWHDVNLLADEARRCGARPWMWSDMIWWWGGQFTSKVSKDILQSNFYYEDMMDFENLPQPYKTQMGAYYSLQKAGFEQVPCVTSWVTGTQEKKGIKFNETNMPATMEWAKKTFTGNQLAGFLCAPWTGPWPTKSYRRAAEVFKKAREQYYPEEV